MDKAAALSYLHAMRPIFHPSIDEITIEGVLHALADPVRAHIFGQIVTADAPPICSAFLEIGDRPVPKSTLSQHFKILREAGLIRSERNGVELLNTARIAELRQRFGSVVDAILAAYHAQAASQTTNG